MSPSAKIIADSISPDGVRLTTIQETFWRPVLAERNTHKIQSKNSASSRARSVHKVLAELHEELALPLAWPREQKGMQGGAEIEGADLEEIKILWVQHAKSALATAERLVEMGLHKSVVNRLLEPYSMHTALITATAWQNYFNQRCSPMAQPEIHAVALLSRQAMEESDPVLLDEGRWHLPYVDPETWEAISVAAKAMASPALDNEMTAMATKISAARCARVSYLTQDGKRDIQADLALYDRLAEAEPPHFSPLEHVATPWPENRQEEWNGLSFPHPHGSLSLPPYQVPVDHLPKVGNLLGWRSLRTEVETAQKVMTYR